MSELEKLLCGKNHTTNKFVFYNPIKTHEFKIRLCQNCDFQLKHTADFRFYICMIQIKHTTVSGFGLIVIEHMGIINDFTWAYQTTCGKLTTCVLHSAPESVPVSLQVVERGGCRVSSIKSPSMLRD